VNDTDAGAKSFSRLLKSREYAKKGQRALEADVVVSNPAAPTYQVQAARKAAHAARLAARKKHKKYKASAAGRGRDFISLDFETHGTFGEGVRILLQRIAATSLSPDVPAVSDMLMSLSLKLVKGNFLCAERVYSRARHCQADRRGAIWGRGRGDVPGLGE
jgi:hypothetical protein